MDRSPSLVRALGVGDLTWLYLVAVVNLNIVPVIAAEGRRALWLWPAVLLCFFLPQGIAVIALAARVPGEGGLYLWTKQVFGDFHGFLCGWCYWMTNMFFIPTLLLYIGGTLAYIGGPVAATLADNRAFLLTLTLILLWATVAVNIRGLGAGKWINNTGGIGALVIACVSMALAFSFFTRGLHPALEPAASSLAEAPWPLLGVMCLALVGLEIGPVMGDEIRDSRRTIRRSVLFGGVLCAAVYIGSTASLVLAIPKSDMKVVQGMLQAIDQMSARLGVHWLLLPIALLMTASIAGSTSAWVAGSARILFVCGLDRYLPKSLGAMHPKFGSPHIALAFFGMLTSAILCMSFIGATVKEAYVTLLDLAVALQMISYLYVFSVLARFAFSSEASQGAFPPFALRVSAVIGLAATGFALAMAFVPSHQIESVWSFEIKMVCAILFFLGMARCLFVYYSRSHTVPAEHANSAAQNRDRKGAASCS